MFVKDIILGLVNLKGFWSYLALSSFPDAIKHIICYRWDIQLKYICRHVS